MTSYNGIKYIGEQIESILSQLAPYDQLIISDNGSTDGTIEFVQKLRHSDSRIILSVYTDKLGIIPNLNHAFPLAKGELIFLADQDDIWLPNRVEYCKELFRKRKKLLLLQTNSEIINNDGIKINKTFFELRKCGVGVIKNYWKNTWQGCNIVFRRKLLEVAYPIPEALPMHDVWLGILADLCGKVKMDKSVLALYRRHENNQSSTTPSKPKQVMRWRLQLASALINNLPRIISFTFTSKRIK
jgi:glycosyltransferase involved in cell wall biosynthesis